MRLKIGQIIALNLRVNNEGTVLQGHPYLILDIDEEQGLLEVAQVDSLEGKEFKAAKKSNKIIYCDEPVETVIDKDSYIQLDNSIVLEYFDDLELMRRQESTLSTDKLKDVIHSYNKYHQNYIISDNKQVYISKSELKGYNPKLNCS